MSGSTAEDYEKMAAARYEYEKRMQASMGQTGAGFADAVRAMKNPLELLGMAFTGLTGSFKHGITAWQYASDTGATLGKNFVGFNLSLMESQLTQDDLSRIVQRTGVNFQTLGEGMESSTKNFFALSAEYSRGAQGAQTYFRDLGYTVEQANEVIASTAASTGTFNKAMKGDRATQEAALKGVLEKSKELAAEMAALTDITGISRKKQMEEREDQDRDVALQTALEDLPKAQQDGFKNITADLQAAGLEKIGRAIFTSEGALSEKEGQFLALMGSAGPAFNQAMLNYKEALKTNDDATIKAAKIRVDQARDEAVQVANSPEFKAMVRARGLMGEYSEDILKLKSATLQLNRIMQENPGMTVSQAIEKRKADYGEKPPKPTQDKQELSLTDLSQTILGIEQAYNQRLVLEADALRVIAETAGNLAATNTAMFGDQSLKDFIRSDKATADAVEKSFQDLKKMTTDAWTKLTGVSLDETKQWLDKMLTNINDMIKAAKTKLDYRDVPPVIRAGGSPGIADFLSSSTNMMSVFENFGAGTPAVLHGMESVIRPEQLNGIINKAAGTAMSSLSGSMQSPSSQFAQINPEVFNEMKNQLTMLNNLMASHLPDISSSMTKQYSALRDLSPDFHA
jgi:hypothetical protein